MYDQKRCRDAFCSLQSISNPSRIAEVSEGNVNAWTDACTIHGSTEANLSACLGVDCKRFLEL
jgi:hypothetical protein